MEQKKEKKHSHTGHRQRIKEKALKGGIDHWQYHEILELLLTYAIPQKDVNPLAHELIDKFGTFGGVLDAGYDQLVKINGIGQGTALFLSLLPEFFTKYTASKNADSILLDTSYKCVNYFKTIGRIRRVEDFYVFCLDAKKRLIKTVRLDSGMASAVNIQLTEFAEEISFKGNKAIIIMHSHPNGNPQPTKADIVATKRLIDIGMTLGIRVDDHIIVTDKEYYSFKHSGLYQDLIDEVKNTKQ